MDILEALDQEVSAQVDTMPVEVILAMMDKWERELEQELCSTRINLPMLLKHYVRLKRMRHYMKRSFEFEWINEARAEFEEKQERYTQLIKEARRNYYVAKRRVEGEHASNCSCRGCRCIEGIERSGQGAPKGRPGRTRSYEEGRPLGQGLGQAS